MRYSVLIVVVCFLLFTGLVYGDSSFDRELVIKDQARANKVEQVLKNLLRTYENEDSREFLDYVSEDRFRQDYLTFTDALYEDFRTYEIHHVEYWVDRVVPDHVKQFFYVRWEKRYEMLDDGRQLKQTGFSRFVFDEVNGKYLLIELAGNDLFGSSLAEWTNETPTIPGQETAPASGQKATPATPASGMADLVIQSAVFADGLYYLDIVIANIGTAVSTATTFQIDRTGGGTFLIPIPALNPGSSYSHQDYTGIYAPSIDLVTIDPNNIVPESNEANNTGVPGF